MAAWTRQAAAARRDWGARGGAKPAMLPDGGATGDGEMRHGKGFLAGASDDLLTTLEALAREVRLDPGEVLFEQGDEGEALYTVEEGTLEISVLSEEGRKLTLDIIRPGAIVGEIALFDPGPRTATVTALEPARLLRLRNADLLAAIRRQPGLAIDMVKLAGQRMRLMNGQLTDQVFLPLPVRLARKLLYLTADGAVEVRMSQAELAEFTGATREAVSRVLGDWKAAGMIESVRRGVRISDRRALSDLAEQSGA